MKTFKLFKQSSSQHPFSFELKCQQKEIYNWTAK